MPLSTFWETPSTGVLIAANNLSDIASAAAARNSLGVDRSIVTSSGLTVTVAPFRVQQFGFAGGSLTVVASGTWFVGVDLYRQRLIALPRLGHRGWIPVARVVCSETEITGFDLIAPVIPASRLPNSLRRIRNGEGLRVLVIGSSLAEGTETNRWTGMLFNASSSESDYKVPSVTTFTNYALGATPNSFMLALLGNAARFGNQVNFSEAGFPYLITDRAPPNGRSGVLNNIDLVVMTCLANGGDYRLSYIEPIVRRIRERGVEVILLTDNPQDPTTSYNTMLSTPLYVDGPEVMRIADYYGVELVDTAAHAFEQHLRYGSGIYTDTIHMTTGTAAGPSVEQPACGHEVYARAIRSVISVPLGRPEIPQLLPPCRLVTDLKTPGDAFVILPKDEHRLLVGGADAGVLGASPAGSSSFSRRFSSAIGASEDLLTLAVGDRATISALCPVGFSIIRYAATGDASVTVDVSIGGVFSKSITLSGLPEDREQMNAIFTPTQWNNSSVLSSKTIDIVVTDGTLKIAALVAWTADMDYRRNTEIDFVGTWGSELTVASMPGRYTDTAGDYATLRTSPHGRRVGWLLASRTNSQPVDIYSGSSITHGVATSGTNNIRLYGGLFAPGSIHTIKLAASDGSPSSGDRSLFVSGAVIVNDR